MFILLTPEQASHVRGLTSPGASLEPIAIAGGKFVLPVAVLDDEAHAMHHAFLSGMPQAESVQWLEAE